jgi:predicted esterase
MLDQFRSDLAIRDVHVPVLMVHGEEDDVIPLNSAKRLFELANEPKTFVCQAATISFWNWRMSFRACANGSTR